MASKFTKHKTIRTQETKASPRRQCSTGRILSHKYLL